MEGILCVSFSALILFIHSTNVLSAELSEPGVAEELVSNPCKFLSTCGSCLNAPLCAWCAQEEFERENPRCDIEENLLNNGCLQEEIVNPLSRVIILKNLNLSDAGAVSGSAIQLKPQHIKLSLRSKEPTSFTLSFRQAEDYPVDLYYLMDLTWSMREHKNKLAQLADVLADSMFNITKNFQLGFGSFIDKVVMPYASMVPSRLENPCGGDFPCVPPYGFQNHLSLTSNVSAFIDEVSNASLSGNLDNAEGGFDAVMQVIVCKDQIKWNEQSRKIILFATDSIFHYAGDGLLGGIVAPNDGNCHLDNNGLYTHSLYQDYPSLSQINKELAKKKINIIFAVPEEKTPLYELLSSHIEGSYTGKLVKDSSNIVHLIEDQYNTIRSKIELKHNTNEFLKVKYVSKCLGDDLEETNICEGLTVGTTVEFDVTVELTSCPKNATLWDTSLVISPVGLEEYLKIDVNMLCECDCEKPENEIVESDKCSTNGTYECGICSCKKNHYGRKCECLEDNAKQRDKLLFCRKTNTSALCSGRGECVCGDCDCYNGPGEERIYGDYCECDTFTCERDSEGRVCGGEQQGFCCGECLCLPGWTGSACDCTKDTSKCKPVHAGADAKLCSDHGECKCGRCICDSNEGGSYSGPFCEDCANCEGWCSDIRPCVQCRIFQSGPLTESECEECSYNITEVDEIDAQGEKEKKCSFKDDDGCSFKFKYVYNETNQYVVFVQRTKECPPVTNVAMVVGIVAGSVFFIGLIVVLVARFCVYLKDKRDWKRFEAEVKKTEWGSETNPLYRQAVSKYQNPMYNPKRD
uniref:Integrin beta n=1 Tax=Hadrurus spadix TaxID=141984 RepID=A0A1W7RAE7_9SCOR